MTYNVSYLSDEKSKFSIAVGSYHGVDTREDPDGEGHHDTASLLEHSTRGYEDAGANDGTNNDGAALDQAKRRLETHLLLLHGLHLLLSVSCVNRFIFTIVRHLRLSRQIRPRTACLKWGCSVWNGSGSTDIVVDGELNYLWLSWESTPRLRSLRSSNIFSSAKSTTSMIWNYFLNDQFVNIFAPKSVQYQSHNCNCEHLKDVWRHSNTIYKQIKISSNWNRRHTRHESNKMHCIVDQEYYGGRS